MIRVRHSAKIYVDDLLALLESVSAPLWASLVVVLVQVLRVPMSWHKGALSARVVWIGWALNLSHLCVRLDPAKFSRLCCLLPQALSSKRCSTHLLERITGKLLWFSSLFRTFRPSLAPLYSDQHAFLPTMTALQPDLWVSLRASLSDDLCSRSLWALRLFLLAPVSFGSASSLSRNCPNCLSTRRTPDVCGFRRRHPTRGPAFYRRHFRKFSASGSISVNPAPPFGHCFGLRVWIALLSRTHVPRPPRQALVASSASRMDVSCSSAARSVAMNFTNFSPGFRSPPRLNLILLHGSFSHSVLLSSSWTHCLVRDTCLCTASSNAITLPPTPLAGRVCRWPKGYALTASRSISTMSPDLRMMWPMF